MVSNTPRSSTPAKVVTSSTSTTRAARADLSVETDRLSPSETLGETMMLSLRLLDGVRLSTIKERFGVDPAVLSAPLITTLVDATGLVIYFTIAKLILHV